MKNSQLYMLLGGMCFVGSLLANHLWDSLLLFGMFIFWNFCAIYIMPKEFQMERAERMHARAKFEIIIHLLEQRRKKK